MRSILSVFPTPDRERSGRSAGRYGCAPCSASALTLQNRLNGRFGEVIVGGFYVDYRGNGIVFEKRGCAVTADGSEPGRAVFCKYGILASVNAV